MDFKKLTIFINVFIAAVLFMLDLKFESIIIVMIVINITYAVLFYYLNKKQSDELIKLSTAIESISNKALPTSNAFYDDYLINKVIYNVWQLDNIYTTKNNELKNSQKELQDSTSNLAHQLRNSLHSIMLHTSHLENDSKSSILINEIHKLNNFTDELIKVSNIDILNNNIETSNYSINDIVLEAIKSNYAFAKQNNITIDYESKYEIDVTVNYRWTLEAIINVINNAIKYGIDNNIVKVSIDENYVYAKVTIQDHNGIITGENKIFDKFYRGNNTENIDGMGVGLYLTKAILIKQNGYIKYHSDNNINKFELFFVKANKKPSFKQLV